jgi:hypothetical protein
MGMGFIGSKEELQELAQKEGHPDPKSVKNFGELINWVAEKAAQKEVKTRPR